MLLAAMREAVLEANLALPKHGLVTFTWGNVSGIDRERQLVVIKPSGVRYENMRAADMVVVDLAGKLVDGSLRPSSDTPTHLCLYRELPALGGIVHTHSTHATAWAQAGREIPALGTTHADYFHGPIRCTRALSQDEVTNDYELNTGKVIVEAIRRFAGDQSRGDGHYVDAHAVSMQAMASPAILVRQHAPFAWGKTPEDAVHNAVVLEELARMAWLTLGLNPQAVGIPTHLLDKHFLRKHGSNAYYGQPLSDEVSG